MVHNDHQHKEHHQPPEPDLAPILPPFEGLHIVRLKRNLPLLGRNQRTELFIDSGIFRDLFVDCLLYTSDAADE